MKPSFFVESFSAVAHEVIERSRAGYEERYPRLKDRFMEALGQA